VILIAALTAYVLADSFSQAQSNKAPEKLTIVRTGGVPTAPFWIAEEQGFFKDEGLEVTYIDFDQGPHALDALRDGQGDITASGELPIVRAIMRGDKIRILAELESDYGENIIGLRDHGVVRPTDFRGKKVGVTKGTVNEFQLISFLEAHGLSEKDVTLVDVPFADAAALLRTGEVDAVSARQATIVQLEKELGENGIVFSTDGIYTFRFLVVANEKFVTERPEVAEKFMRALIRAESFLRDSPEEARKLTAQKMGVEQSIVDEVWQRYHFSINLSQPIFVSLEDEAKWLLDRNPDLGTQIPNFLSYMYFEALESAKPGAITIPH
jgi:NitT/TauT family transport system substrate-binding protein